jgi:uncharacterized protein
MFDCFWTPCPTRRNAVIPFPTYPAHAAYIAAAGRRPDLWRVILGVLLVVGIYVALILGVAALVNWRYGTVISGGLFLAMTTGHNAAGMLILLFSFGGLALGAFAAVRILHDRRAGTLFGPARLVLRDFLTVALPVTALNIAMLPFVLSMPNAEPGVSWGHFLVYLVPALAGLLVQTGAEEIAFRGYLQQQLAARFRHPFVWMVLPSVLFAAGHYSPQDYGSNALGIAVWAGVFGLCAADLTARTGTIGAAMGFHFATNLAALQLVALFGNLDGLALWTITVDFNDSATATPLMAADFLSMFVAWLIARLMLRV